MSSMNKVHKNYSSLLRGALAPFNTLAHYSSGIKSFANVATNHFDLILILFES